MTLKDFLNELGLEESGYDYYYKKDDPHYLTFQLSGDIYAIEIENIEEVIEVGKIVKSDNKKKYMKGLIAYKKTMVDLIDLRLKLGMKEKKYDYKTTIIITSINEKILGLIVDNVIEITGIPHKDIKFNNAENILSCKGSFVKGIAHNGKENKKILDINKIFYCDQYNILRHNIAE